MLCLKRYPGQRLLVQCPDGTRIWIELIETNRRCGRIGVSAPPEYLILREELIPADEPATGERA